MLHSIDIFLDRSPTNCRDGNRWRCLGMMFSCWLACIPAILRYTVLARPVRPLAAYFDPFIECVYIQYFAPTWRTTFVVSRLRSQRCTGHVYPRCVALQFAVCLPSEKKTGLNRVVSRFTHGHRTQFDVVAEGACGLDTPPPVKRDFIAIAARAHPRSIKIFGVIFFYQWKFNFDLSIFTNLSLSKRLICVLQKYVVG